MTYSDRDTPRLSLEMGCRREDCSQMPETDCSIHFMNRISLGVAIPPVNRKSSSSLLSATGVRKRAPPTKRLRVCVDPERRSRHRRMLLAPMLFCRLPTHAERVNPGQTQIRRRPGVRLDLSMLADMSGRYRLEYSPQPLKNVSTSAYVLRLSQSCADRCVESR